MPRSMSGLRNVRSKEHAALVIDPLAGTAVRDLVARVPCREMARVPLVGLFSNEHQRAVEVLDERVEYPSALCAAEAVGRGKPPEPVEHINASPVLVDVIGVAHGNPVPHCDGNVPEPVDRASKVEVDEGRGATVSYDDVLQADIVVTHEVARECLWRRTVPPRGVERRNEICDGLVVAALQVSDADEQIVISSPRGIRGHRDVAGDEPEYLKVTVHAHDLGYSLKADLR